MLRKRYIILTVIVLFILMILLFFRFGGELLVKEDNIEEIEEAVLVLLMGSVGDRALGAYELYENGNIDQILLVESHIEGEELLGERDIAIPGDADLSKHILTELGTPQEDITILPGHAESTKDEAVTVKEYLKDNPDINTVILTTSKFHSYRANLIFNKALKDQDVAIYSSPTPYDPFEAKGWYQDREDIQRVITEYIKLAHYLLLEQFQL